MIHLNKLRNALSTYNLIIARSISSAIESSKMFTEIQQLNQPEIKIRNRPYLPGSQSVNLPETISLKSSPFLKTVQFNYEHTKADYSLSKIGGKINDISEEFFRSQQYYAIHIRNLPIQTAKDFQEVMKHLNRKPMDYINGNGFREKLLDRVYTASDEPPEFSIEPHNEMSYLHDFPTKVCIYLVLISHS